MVGMYISLGTASLTDQIITGIRSLEAVTLQPVYMVLMITRVSGYCEDSEIIIWRNINWADYLSEDIMR